MTKKVYFQIGTNDDNDMFRQLVQSNKPDIVILIEPNESLIHKIKDNYRNIDNVFVYNNDVYYENDEIVEVFLPEKADNKYTHSQFSLLQMNDCGDKSDMVIIKSKGITFDTICKNHSINVIEYLQINTEGLDSENIKRIDLDLSKYKINKIKFEKCGFEPDPFEKWRSEPDRFTNYNKEKANYLGINSMNFTNFTHYNKEKATDLSMNNTIHKHHYILQDVIRFVKLTIEMVTIS